jgi:subtilisin family serine protease
MIDPEVTANEMVREHGVEKNHVYRHALKGFAGKIPANRLAKIQADPRVAYVQEDWVMHTMASDYEHLHGIERIRATDVHASGRTGKFTVGPNAGESVDVAILDTGIDLQHSRISPSTSPERMTSFVKKEFGENGVGDDVDGHGTGVAGVILQTAPDVRLWGVKVGTGPNPPTTATLIHAVDYVTGTRDSCGGQEPIEVVNMSLGGPVSAYYYGTCADTFGDALYKAICTSIERGVTYVVAAGNEGERVQDPKARTANVPAAYPEVITVAALADSDGASGGLGLPTSTGDYDDTFASFSNFGPEVDLIAPGVDIATAKATATTTTTATAGTDRYIVASGTSLAAPYVAGVAALYIADHPGATPAEVRDALVSSGVTGSSSEDPYPWDWDSDTDPDWINEPRVDASCAILSLSCP